MTLDANLNPGFVTGRLDEDNISWRAGIDFKPLPRTLIYLNVSRGYKAGSAPTTAATSAVQYRPAVQETVLAYEIGAKSTLIDRKLDVSATAFYYDYTNKQLLGRNVYNPNILGAISALVNIPKSRIIGAEAQATVRPVRGLTLTAAGTYLDTKVQGDFYNYSLIGVLTNFNGSPFPYTPKWQLTFDGEQRVPLSSRLVGFIGSNASYRTAMIAGFGTDPRLAINAYWLVDARIGIEAANGRWNAQLFGRNLSNAYYWNNVAAGADNVRRYTGMPLTYGIQVGMKL